MIIEINQEEVKEKLKEIFLSRFNISLDAYNEDDLNKELIGSKFMFTARELVYLFFDIEKKLDIKIPQEEIVAGNFKSFNQILELVTKQILIKENVTVLHTCNINR